MKNIRRWKMSDKKRFRQKKYRWKASYTVEASMIFPIIFLVLVFLLFMTFYSHDIAVQKAVCYEAAIEAVHGGIVEDTGTTRCVRPSKEELMDYAQKRLSAGTIDGKVREVSVILKEEKKQVQITGEKKSNAVCEETNAPDFLRNMRKLQKMAEKVKEQAAKD